MSWRYRVYKKNGEYSIREHYEDDNGKLIGHTKTPCAPTTYDDWEEDPIESLRWQLEKMARALEEPILEDNTENDEDEI